MDLDQIGALYEDLKLRTLLSAKKRPSESATCLFIKDGKTYTVEIYHSHYHGSSLYVSRDGRVRPTEFYSKSELLRHINECDW